jgi:hypothetical protein
VSRRLRKQLLALLLLAAGVAQAHPLAPALLDLRASAPGVYEVLWRTSLAAGGARQLRPQFPAACRQRGDARSAVEPSPPAFVARWTLDCGAAGLRGSVLQVAGLENSPINVILRLQDEDGAVLQALLDAQRPAFQVPAARAPPPVFGAYLRLGVEHLLSGIDHLLFIAGLVLLVHGGRLLLTVSAFTVGHSLTLSLAVLGWLRVPASLAELGIAASLLLLGVELARPAGARVGWLRRAPLAMAAGFGLLHGLGFAGALSELGLPASDIPLALFAFNLGIELGQLLVVAGLLLLATAWRRLDWPRASPAWQRALPAYATGSLAGYWFIERLATLAA